MNRSTVEEIKARLAIEDLIGSYIKLEKAGKSFKARCPFHHEKTASFFVSPDRGGYYCFGCGAKGDIFSFVEQFEGLDFKGALKILAERTGVPLVFDQAVDSERDQLFRIMEAAAKYFEGALAQAKEAQEYISSRGVSDKTRTDFRIGWAPLGWRNLYDFLRSQKWSNELIERSGLAKRASDGTGNYYDRFRGRVMFPLCDSSGRVIAFSGRILKDDGQSAKYLNSPDTPLFDKSSVLYGLDKAKSFIRRLDYAILVEGQMDLIMSHQAGIKNTVASSGTALADVEANRDGVVNNLGLLRRLSGNIIIAFDADTAGRKAAMRAASIALTLGMDVKIADIQGGKDPADLVAHNPEDWKNILRVAKPIVEFELNNVIREVSDPRKIPRAVRERVLPFVVAIGSATDRAYALKLIADRTDLPEAALWDDLAMIEAKTQQPAGAVKSEQGPAKTASFSATNSDMTSAMTNAARLDMVSRRLIGLLNLIERTDAPKAAAYRTKINEIAPGSFDQMVQRSLPILSDLAFEAEAFYGAEPERFDFHMTELITNYQADLLNGELVETMAALRAAEKAGDQAVVASLAQKCQELSARKAVIFSAHK